MVIPLDLEIYSGHMDTTYIAPFIVQGVSNSMAKVLENLFILIFPRLGLNSDIRDYQLACSRATN